jgi:hypothetical protein
MTTASPNSSSVKSAKPPMSKKRIAVFVAGALTAIVIFLLIFNFSALNGYARLGSSYVAHITCSCRYIEGRDMESCAEDGEPGTEIVNITDDPENKRITASVLFLAKAVAERRGDFGCQQLNEAEISALD